MDAAMTEDRVAFARQQVESLVSSLEELAKPDHLEQLDRVVSAVVSCLASGGKILFCGNGGSAADAQHLSAELVGRQNYDRAPLAGISLSVDTSALTAIGNDYGYDKTFSRQVQALARPGDVLFGLSTSGRSANVVKAFDAAGELGVTTIAFTGRDPRDMARADLVVAVPAEETAKIQELHITCNHIVFALVERAMYPRQG